MRRKTFTFLYDKFTQDNVYRILSQSVWFCRLHIKNILVCFLSVHSVYTFFLLYGWHVLFLLASLGPLGAHSIICFPSTCYLTMKLKRDAALQTDSRIFLVFNSILRVHFCEQLICLSMPQKLFGVALDNG